MNEARVTRGTPWGITLETKGLVPNKARRPKMNEIINGTQQVSVPADAVVIGFTASAGTSTIGFAWRKNMMYKPRSVKKLPLE